MSGPVGNVLTFASIPAVAVVVGGVVAAFRTPSPAVRSAVQHIAAGVLFAALATELLPDVVHRRLPWVTLGGFTLGIAVMLLLKAFTRRMEERKSGSASARLPTSLLLTSGIDIALDGLLIGISFAVSARQGILLTIALTLEVFFLGVAAAAALGGAGAARSRVVVATCVFAALLLGGASAGAHFLGGVGPATLDAVMSFGVAALLYLVTEELLVEAHEVNETPLLTAMFFVGFVVLLTIEMLV